MDGFYFVFNLLHNGALKSQFRVDPVDVLPLQAHKFRPSKPETYSECCHRSVRLRENGRETMELFNSHGSWFSYPLRRIPDLHQLHWIPLRGHVPAPHCVIPQSLNESPDVDLGFWSESERLNPQLKRPCL